MNYLTPRQAAKVIGVTHAQVCWLIRGGKLKARRSRNGVSHYEVSEAEARRYRSSPRKRGPKARNH